jgi:hypothetical protein
MCDKNNARSSDSHPTIKNGSVTKQDETWENTLYKRRRNQAYKFGGKKNQRKL